MDPVFKDLGAVVVFVEDLTTSKNFYGEVLGLEMKFEDEVSAMFSLESVAFFVMQVSRASVRLKGEATVTPSTNGATSILCAPTDDVDALHAELVTRGVSFIHAPISQPWGMLTAAFKDPDGHVWELFQEIG